MKSDLKYYFFYKNKKFILDGDRFATYKWETCNIKDD